MAILLRQSTASQELSLGYFVDSIDGNTEETALTIANTDIKIWKAGATTLANKNSGGATHISNGIYYCVLDDTDTNTLGSLVIFVHVAGALTVRVECQVLSAKVYDSLVAGTDNLEVDTVEWLGTPCATPTTGGVPEVDVTHIVGATTLAELGVGAPPANPTPAQALMLPYMTLRNRLDVEASNKTVYNDAGTAICTKVLTDNGTTYSEAEMVTP